MSILSDRFPTTHDYDLMPHVHEIEGIFTKYGDAVASIKDLMIHHGVQNEFALFSFHKHFDVPADHVLLLEKTDISGGDRGEVVYPVPVADLDHVHPVAYYVDGNRLQPYKYARGEGPDLNLFHDFLLEFINLINKCSLARIFAIKSPNVSPGVDMAEAEIPEFWATALAPIKYFGPDYCPGSQAAAVFEDCNSSNEHHGQRKTGKHTVWVDADKAFNPAVAAAFAVLQTGGSSGMNLKLQE